MADFALFLHPGVLFVVPKEEHLMMVLFSSYGWYPKYRVVPENLGLPEISIADCRLIRTWKIVFYSPNFIHCCGCAKIVCRTRVVVGKSCCLAWHVEVSFRSFKPHGTHICVRSAIKKLTKLWTFRTLASVIGPRVLWIFSMFLLKQLVWSTFKLLIWRKLTLQFER